jgi:hypothetical protein
MIRTAKPLLPRRLLAQCHAITHGGLRNKVDASKGISLPRAQPLRIATRLERLDSHEHTAAGIAPISPIIRVAL